MTATTFYEILGYVASGLVAASLTMRSVLRLRLLNLVGAVAFAAYGLLIRSWPVAGVNLFIAVVNVFFLASMLGKREYLQLFPLPPRSDYLRRFLGFYAADIRRLCPDFPGVDVEADLAVFVLRDMVPAGIFLARRREEGALHAELDYVTPPYRDLKAARFLYGEKARWFAAQGVRRVLTRPGAPAHRRYLLRMGFAPRDDGLFEKTL